MEVVANLFERHVDTKSGECFLLKRSTWGPTPPATKKRGVFLYPKIGRSGRAKKDGTPVAVPTGAINFGEPGTNGTGSSIF